MNLDAIKRPLSIEEVEFRVQSYDSYGNAIVLPYKNARVDMARLDEAFTPFGWQRDYKMVGAQQFAGVGIKYEGEWVWKWDVGTESNTEKEKGLASDGFKRACFNIGIGRELYDYPLIRIKLTPNELEKKTKNKINPNYWVWFSQFDENGKINYLGAKDKDKLRFQWGQYKK